jgi:hypothetical protein
MYLIYIRIFQQILHRWMNQNPQTKLQFLTVVSKSFLYLIKNGSKPLATYTFAYTSCEGIESKQNEINTSTTIHTCIY